MKKTNNEIYWAELADGNLRTFLKIKDRGLTLQENLELLKCLIQGLIFLKEKNIAHRDIKPNNILYFISEKNEIKFKLTDFGEVKLNMSHKVTVAGTHEYMAPEVSFFFFEQSK